MPTDVELQKLTPRGEALVPGNRPSVASGAGNQWPCSIPVAGVTPRAVALESLKLWMVAGQGDGHCGSYPNPHSSPGHVPLVLVLPEKCGIWSREPAQGHVGSGEQGCDIPVQPQQTL